ncbi:MAG: DUF420 domain-containing protein [Deltaproteobacteria bacterium]|nr:DUF420 domain-containing protein [Deltaproteobacteria bacterium]
MTPEWVLALPAVNASINSLATLFLILGFWTIKFQEDPRKHKLFMATAFGFSVLFLISYLIYHARVGSVPFESQGWIRTVYFLVLVPHILLSAVVVPLVVLSILLAIRQKTQAHKKMVRWTFPIWIYVSISGVVVYFMLYHIDKA